MLDSQRKSKPKRKAKPRAPRAKPGASGPLKNPRHERFARNMAKGVSATEAFREAGYTGERSGASRLLATNEDVVRRIKELQELVSKRVVYELEDAMRELDEALEAAKKAPKASRASQMAQVLALKTKITGLQVRERDNNREPITHLEGDVLKNELNRIDREIASASSDDRTPTTH